MKARLLTISLNAGHVARDFIRLVRENHESATDTRPLARPAKELLESFRDNNRLAPADPVVPVKGLVTVLTEGLRGTLNRSRGTRKVDPSGLFRGCRVRLAGIPERVFVIVDFDWDRGEVRIKEVGGTGRYVLPWDALEFVEEQQE